jgi:hypothetical protein
MSRWRLPIVFLSTLTTAFLPSASSILLAARRLSLFPFAAFLRKDTGRIRHQPGTDHQQQ